jgi:hypothetical protein
VTDALIPRLGGPMGRHAARVGPWFTPLPWAVLVAAGLFSLLFLRHVPCLQTEADDVVNSYIRACYSDLQPVFLGEGLGLGGSPLTSDQMTLPPLIAVLVLACRAIAVALGAPVGVGATLQEQVDASVAFFAVTTVALFACLLIVVLCVARLGRGHTRAPSWDAMLVAGSPIVLAVGLVDWTLVPVVLAVVVAVGLRRGWRTATAVGVGAAASFLLVHAPLLLSDAGRVFAFYHGEVNEETGYGSLWYLLELMGVPLRATGSFGFAVLMLFLGVLIAWLYVTGRRPRVASLVAVVVLATTMLGAAYPPQTALWLLFVVVLALPRRTELVALTATQVAYYLAIWGWLGGGLTLAQSGPYLLYWLAIAFRWGVECWLLVRILRSFR